LGLGFGLKGTPVPLDQVEFTKLEIKVLLYTCESTMFGLAPH
jgi:hypothetical protein